MADKQIAYLRAHSYYGFLESLISPGDLAQLADHTGIQALGLTDHNFLTGAIEFFQACQGADIQPILGLEIDVTFQHRQGRLTLLAKNQTGWSNLCRLSTLSLTEGTQIGTSQLSKHREGLLCLVGGPAGILRELLYSSSTSLTPPKQFLEELQTLFPKNCFIEIQRYSNGPLQNEAVLLQFSLEFKLPIIASQNIHYKNQNDQELFSTLCAMKHNTTRQGLLNHQVPPGLAFFPSQEDFSFRFRDIPEALDNHQLILERCNLDLPIGQTHYPEFPTPDGVSQADFLRQKAYRGAQEHYHELTPQIVDRLDYELDIISKMGYDPIFLIVEDILNHARKLGIPTSSRGSAASSLVAHCLKITSPDPLKLNLYFERFLNPARKKPPDIDTDISSKHRELVIQYVFEKYGKDQTAMVSTINRYRPRSALGDVAKVYGVSPETVRQLTKKLPHSYRWQRDDDQRDPFDALQRKGTIPYLRKIIDDARAILDLPRHLSVHPGGILVSPFPIQNLIPLVHSDSLKVNHTQFDLEDIEKIGMVKIDLLGIRGLTVLGEVANRIQSWHIREFNDGLEVLENIPKGDPKTANTVSQAKTIGCFQIESPGMRATLREIKAKTPEDIMAALALYRPGPLRGGLRDAFVRRFRGEERIEHIHESLSQLLEDTFGVILYQEQVLRIAHELGGLYLSQADILRRAMSHFDPGSVMETLRQNFIEGAAYRKGVPNDVAERIWEMMAAFAGYGFPKAHAASYAQLAWNSAWCKTHYPAEFMAAVLGFSGGYYSQRVYLMEARRLKLTIQPPHINHSNLRFRVKYPKGKPVLYMGLNQVRELTQKTVHSIVQKRPFHSLDDFLLRVDPNKKEAENLVKCGALDDLITIPEGLKRLSIQSPPGQMRLFSTQPETEDWSPEQRFNAQYEILGVNLSMSPLEKYADQIHAAGAVSTLEAQNMIGELVKVAGMRQTMRRFRTQSGQMMAYLNLEDMEGALHVVIKHPLYQRYYQNLQEVGPFLVEGVIEEDQAHGRTRMTATRLELL